MYLGAFCKITLDVPKWQKTAKFVHSILLCIANNIGLAQELPKTYSEIPNNSNENVKLNKNTLCGNMNAKIYYSFSYVKCFSFLGFGTLAT